MKMRTINKPVLLAATLLATTVLAGCAGSPPVNYYTLLSAAPDAAQSRVPRGGDVMIEVVPVSVPTQVDQPQIMLRDAAGSVTPRYSERWTAPLADEVQSALSDGLTRQLGVMDVRSVKPARGQAVWRVQVDVQRFDSINGEAVVVDATWRLRGINLNAPASLCRTQIRKTVSEPGIAALVQAHQSAMGTLSDRIARRISGQSAGGDTAGVTETCRSQTESQVD